MNILLSLLTALNFASVFAQQTSVDVHISSGSPILAMPLDLSATVTNPKGGKTILDLPASTTDSFAIAQIKEAPLNPKNPTVQVFQIRILPLALGKATIRLFWNTKTPSGVFETQSPPLIINVAERPLKNLKIYDIDSPLKAWPLLWPWIIGVLLIALLIWAYWKFKKEPLALQNSSVIIDSRPPHVIAKEEIEHLKASTLWKEARYREFYFELTEILKRYFERRFDTPATKMTSFELYRQLKHAELDVSTLGRFKSLFDRADLVKFAKVTPELNWGEMDADNAMALIDITMPKEQALPEMGSEVTR